MKKTVIAVLALALLLGAAFIIRQNLPSKRFARHLVKARLFVREKNYTAARLEYEQAFKAKGGFTPYATLEVLNFTNQVNMLENNPADAIANTRKYLEANPDSKDAKITLSQLAFKVGDFTTAFDAVHSALDQDPGYFPARLLLTEVRTKQGRLDLAEEQLRYLYKAYPDSVLALLPLAENVLRQGRVSEARTYVAAALKGHPTNVAARVLLLDSYLLEGKGDSAQMVLDDWRKAEPSVSLATEIRKAQIQSLGGKFAEAESTLTPFLEAKEENLPAFYELALLKAKQGRYDSAVKVYVNMAEISPTAAAQPQMLSVYLNFKAQVPARSLETLKSLQIRNKGSELPTLIAVAYLALGQDAKLASLLKEQPDSLRAAIQAFAAQLEPDKEYIGQWALVNYFTILHQPLPAAKAIEDLHTRWPKNRIGITLWTGSLASRGRYADAAKQLETVANPTFAEQAALLSFYVKAGLKDKTLALGQKLLKDHPDKKGVNLFLADYYTAHNDKAKAAEYYEKELVLDPGNLVALNNLAWEYGVNRADLEKAKPYIAKLKTKRMLDPRILDTIGWILAKNGKNEEALQNFRTAVNLVPDHPTFNYHLAYVLIQLGKKDEAKKCLATALASKVPFEERKDAEKLQAQQG
jgi:tetratricopeptide (TPR) repeat protein